MASSVSSNFTDLKRMKDILGLLNKQRQSGTLCDVSLVIAGQCIRAHSNILSGASSYFATILGVNVGTSDTDNELSAKNEVTEPQAIMHQIIDMNIDAVTASERVYYCEALRKIVDYIYSGEIVLNDIHVSQTQQLARLLGVDQVVAFCERFADSLRKNRPQDNSTDSTSNDLEARITFIDIDDNDSYREKNLNALHIIRRKCNTCGFIGRTKRDLRDHRHNVHLINRAPPGVFRCSICSLDFDSKLTLLNHKKIHWYEAPSLRFSCSLCQKKFRWRWEVAKHTLQHSQLRPFVCTLCSNVFKTQATLNHHLKLHKRKDPTVDIASCQKQFRVKQIADENSDVQSDIPVKKDNFLCVTCGKLFKTALKFHLHVDTCRDSEPEYRCHKCDYTAKVTEALKSHLLNKHNIAPLNSDKSTVFISNNVIATPPRRVHVNRNKGIFECSVCSKVFDMKQNLKRHMIEVHNPERPFKCNECDFTAKRFENLKNHAWYLHKISITSARERDVSNAMMLSENGLPLHAGACSDDIADTVVVNIDNPRMVCSSRGDALNNHVGELSSVLLDLPKTRQNGSLVLNQVTNELLCVDKNNELNVAQTLDNYGDTLVDVDGMDSNVDSTAISDSNVDSTAISDTNVDSTAISDSNVDNTAVLDSYVDSTTILDSDVATAESDHVVGVADVNVLEIVYCSVGGGADAGIVYVDGGSWVDAEGNRVSLVDSQNVDCTGVTIAGVVDVDKEIADGSAIEYILQPPDSGRVDVAEDMVLS